MPTEPSLEFLYEITIELEAALAVGENPHGNRQIIPLKGGSFTGPRLRGKVVQGEPIGCLYGLTA
jgi:Protein of unknown function (DUF3237)